MYEETSIAEMLSSVGSYLSAQTRNCRTARKSRRYSSTTRYLTMVICWVSARPRSPAAGTMSRSTGPRAPAWTQRHTRPPSSRADFITQAICVEKAYQRLKEYSGHASWKTFNLYAREAETFQDNPAGAIGL